VAVSVIADPLDASAGEAVRAVAVATYTVTVSAFEVLAACVWSPAYTAVMECTPAVSVCVVETVVPPVMLVACSDVLPS
jgi:uncharacterized membrane protein